jgi:hypothetical protein
MPTPASLQEPAAPDAGATAEPQGPLASRVRIAAALLVALQLLVRGWVLAGRDHYADDFTLLHLADAGAVLSPSYLFHDHDGQFMPGGLLLVGLVERVAPLEWWAAALTVLLMQALASLALLRLLRVVLGDRPLLLVPLTFGLFTPLTLGSTTWWAAALNTLPLQIGLAVFLAEAICLSRTGARRHGVRATLAFAATLLFYLKAVLLPWIGVAVVALVLLRDGERAPLAAAWRRCRSLWTGSLLVTAGWAVAYLLTRDRPAVSGGDAGEVVLTVLTGFRALATAALGGPTGWVNEAPSSPHAQPPLWTVVAGALLLAGACGWTCVHRRGGVLVWGSVVAMAAAGLLLAGAGRSGLGLGDVAPMAGRYYAVEAVLLPLAGALLATLPPRTGAPAPPRGGRPAVALTTVATALFLVVALASTLDHARAWSVDRTGTWLANARESLAAAGSAPLLDQAMPSDVMWTLAAPANRISRTLSPLEDRPPIGDWTPELRVLDADGHLRPAEVVDGPAVAAGPVPSCGWAISPGGGTAVGLAQPLFDWEWTARLDYVADRAGTVTVALTSGDTVRAEVRPGPNTLYVRLVGAGSSLTITTQTRGLGLCVRSGTVGNLAVR